MNIELTEPEIQRYARQILLPEIGGTGQMKLRAARVLVVGAGGLGAPLLLYLAAAGIGAISVIDDDRVELSNLQRQVIFDTGDIGTGKAGAAAARLRALNPEVAVTPLAARLTRDNAAELIAAHDLVCDGSDSFATRFAVSDGAVAARRTLVSAAVLRFEGQVSVFKPHAGPDQPCYRCLYPEAPPPDLAPSCGEAGILGAVTGMLGALQAGEAVKEILGIGDTLAGRLLLWNALDSTMRAIRLRRDPQCPACGHAHG